MAKIKFAMITITIMAEENDINDHFDKVEEEFNDLFYVIDEVAGSDQYELISLKIAES